MSILSRTLLVLGHRGKGLENRRFNDLASLEEPEKYLIRQNREAGRYDGGLKIKIKVGTHNSLLNRDPHLPEIVQNYGSPHNVRSDACSSAVSLMSVDTVSLILNGCSIGGKEFAGGAPTLSQRLRLRIFRSRKQ